jgi:Raf kinase inhibitor-like YbhB/YbcL family protein
MRITSSAFGSNDTIPAKYSCSGKDAAPPLAFDDVPKDARSLALIVDDPDAPRGDWVHWLVYDLPPTTHALGEGATDLPREAKTGVNDFRNEKYGGPCPPPGKPHRYFFRLFALDNSPGLPAGASKKELEDAMRGHILDQAELVGTFGR